MKEIEKLPESHTELHNWIVSDSDKRVGYTNPTTGQRFDAVRSSVMSLKCYQIDCWVGSGLYTAIAGLDSLEVFDCFIDICTKNKTFQFGEMYTKN